MASRPHKAPHELRTLVKDYLVTEDFPDGWVEPEEISDQAAPDLILARELWSLIEQLESHQQALQGVVDSLRTPEGLIRLPGKALDVAIAIARAELAAWDGSNPATDLGTSPAEESGRTEADPATERNSCEKCKHETHEPGACEANVGTGYMGPVLCRCGVPNPASRQDS